MDTVADNSPKRMLPSARVLAAAPHRLLFLVGACNVLLAMAWWAAWLADARWQLVGAPQPAVYAGWMHALIMQFQVLPSFFFGFLLTTFPRWMGLRELSAWHYLPVGLGLLGGQALTLVGLLGVPHLLHLGAIFTLAGWVAGCVILGNLLRQERGRTWHARSCFAALLAGVLGWSLYVAHLHGADAALVLAAIRIGTFGLLLPVYVTVAHRMFPFFANNVVPGYTPWRPLRWLGLFWAFALLHLALELAVLPQWTWLADLPLLALALAWAWKNWPRRRAPALLTVLFIGFAWLPVALAMYAGNSLWALLDGSLPLGRAPAHALFVGFMGSLLVAMVTRVTAGHSGRMLQLGPVAALTFALLQVVAVLRIAAELQQDLLAWMAVAALGWLLAFLPWVLRSAWIYLTPRVDRKPG